LALSMNDSGAASIHLPREEGREEGRLLEVTNLKVRYGGITAVKDISFSVSAGEMVCLIGANGAGKTSTLKALARMIPADGEIYYAGRRINGFPAHTLISQGLALVPEGRGVFARLTVAENLAMGAYHRHRPDERAAVQEDEARMYTLFPRLAERRRQLAGTLSGGEQQMLAIGRALMGKPQLLLLDEPSMGLAPLLVQAVFDAIRSVAQSGVTILLVEQNARLALTVCNRGYVLESGAITLSDSAANLLADPRVRAAYLGE
jgi:branched-chain amino acid transport system ATP-binding protein